jgi:hypothetical protein
MATANWNYETKPGQGWVYDNTQVEYDAILDLDQDLPIYYNRLGDTTVWTNETI